MTASPPPGHTTPLWKEAVIIAAIIAAVATIIVALINGVFSSSKGSAQSAPQVPPVTTSSRDPTKSPSLTPKPTHSNSDSPTLNVAEPTDSPSFVSEAPSPTKIPLADLCNAPDQMSYICGESFGGTVQIGSTLFTYHGENNAFAEAQPPTWDLVLQLPKSTCTSISMKFGSEDGTANLQLITSSSSPVTASASGKVGTLTAKLKGGAFKLQANNSNGSQVYVDGYAMCNSPSGE